MTLVSECFIVLFLHCNRSCLIFVTIGLNIIQVLEIGSVGKGISQDHPLFYAHAATVTIL